MSPANVYRFFGAKSEINAAVARHLMNEVEQSAQSIAHGPGSADQRLRALILSNEAMNAERYVADRKLHDMVEAALDENWPIISDHIDRIDAALEDVIARAWRAANSLRAMRSSRRGWCMPPVFATATRG